MSILRWRDNRWFECACQRSLATNECPFCSTPIEECLKHCKYKKLMKNPDEIQRLLEEHFNYDETSDNENSEDDINRWRKED